MTRTLALAGALEPIWLLGGSVIFGTFRPGYDATHAISELGQQGSELAVAWNVLGFGIAALLYALFALALRAALGDGWVFRMTLLQAIFLAAGGIFSCDPGCPVVMTTWQGWAHTVAGLSYFALTCTAPIVAWRTLRRRPGWGSLGAVSLAAGLILVGLFFAGPFFGPERVGITQRITLGVAGAWTAIVAVRLWGLDAAIGRRQGSPRPG